MKAMAKHSVFLPQFYWENERKQFSDLRAETWRQDFILIWLDNSLVTDR